MGLVVEFEISREALPLVGISVAVPEALLDDVAAASHRGNEPVFPGGPIGVAADQQPIAQEDGGRIARISGVSDERGPADSEVR
ncbi:hypothetical protein [Halosimplex pelagicum]|uniref:Uncharacterized protein n=1 Tax=Halosimplex pelagicum TaxID=869886 RepID=A0A7D5SV74_9EURY|nr:hypothetical protein [Halosimplex pelagicum]QLH82027.1 hypothetical protein HZS54_10515 [Halosimplex pelagicum]